MNKHYTRLTTAFARLLIITLAGCFTKASAQEYIFNRITTKDGLSSNSVYAVWRDPQGYLWVGTETGLQRYDGYNFIYPNYGHNNLPKQSVDQILEDKQGNMWLRLGTTVGIFNTHTFQFTTIPVHYKNGANNGAIRYLSTDAGGNIFLVELGHTWYYFNPAKNSFEEDAAPFSIPESLKVYFVYDDAPKGLMWAGGSNGFVVYDKNKKTLYTPAYNPLNLPLLNDSSLGHHVTTFFIDSKRRYWVVNWDINSKLVRQNLRCYDEEKGCYTKDTAGYFKSIHRYFEMNNIKEFGNRNVVVYGTGCLIFNQSHKFESFFDSTRSNYNISYNNVKDVFQDKQNLLWLATDNGLYNTQAVTTANGHLILNEDKAHAEITSVLYYKNKNNDSEIWIGTWGSRGIIPLGKSIYQDSKTELYKTPYPDANFKSVWDLLQHSRSRQVWAACQAGRIFVYDPAKDKSIYLTPATFKGVTIRQIEEDQNGNLWFGCHNGNVYKWNYGSDFSDSSFHFIYSTGSFISHLLLDKRNRLWVSSGNRPVTVIDANTNQKIKEYDAGKDEMHLSDNNSRQVLQINDSLYAIACDVLNFLHTNTGKITKAIPLDNHTIGRVLTLQCDNAGQIWLSTTTGIYRYNSSRNSFKLYTQQDGLLTAENEEYTMTTSYKLPNGDLVFGGSQNLVVFNPQQYKSALPPRNVTVTGLSLFNKSLPVDSLMKLKKIDLSHTQNSITIHFASLDFSQVNKLTYYYKLEGADKDWIAADQLQATYNLLPPGNYTFAVRAQNEEGVYSSDATELHFYIRPSFWQSVWFYILLGLVTAGLLYYLHWQRLQRLLQVERVRSRLARDLHDDMGSTLSTINILSNMALQKAGSDEKTTKEFISRISSNSSRMMEAMDDIVWSINPVNDSMQKVSARMKEFAGNALEAQDIDYTFHIDEAIKELHFNMDTRRSIFLIFKEAINNILKYAEATQVTIDMVLKKKEMILTIRDNGRGFDPNKPVSTSRGNGVKNMHKRADAMKANLQLQTAPGKGTCLELRIPV